MKVWSPVIWCKNGSRGYNVEWKKPEQKENTAYFVLCRVDKIKKQKQTKKLLVLIFEDLEREKVFD